MKKLISAHTVEDAYKAGKTEIAAPPKSTIITPEAYTVAKKLGLRFTEEETPAIPKPLSGGTTTLDEKAVRLIVERVLDRLPPEKRKEELVKEAVVQVLSGYLKS